MITVTVLDSNGRYKFKNEVVFESELGILCSHVPITNALQIMTEASVWLMGCSNSEDVIMHCNRLTGAIDVGVRELFISWTVYIMTVQSN